MRRSYSLAWCSRLPPPQQRWLGDEYLKRGHFLNTHTRKSKGNCCLQSVFQNCFRNQADGFVRGGCALVCSFIRGGGGGFTFCSGVLGPGFLCLPGVSAKCSISVLIPGEGSLNPHCCPFCLGLHTLGWHDFSVT